MNTGRAVMPAYVPSTATTYDGVCSSASGFDASSRTGESGTPMRARWRSRLMPSTLATRLSRSRPAMPSSCMPASNEATAVRVSIRRAGT
jgi:hypothetical protein